MENCSIQNPKKWLLKAEGDLKAAKLLYKADYLDIAIYHTQQCAEKSLKGYLIFVKHSLVKSHDLVALVALCAGYNSDFFELSPLAARLTPFSVLFRYPDVDFYPEKNTVLAAIQDAEKIYLLIQKTLSLS